MARVFTVTAASETVPLDDEGRGEIAFTVANATGRQLRGRTRVVTQDQTEKNWLTIQAEPERDFPVGSVQQFTVQVTVPPGTKEGRYTFHLDAYSVENPNEDFTQGPSIAFTVAKREVKHCRWCIPALVAVVVIVIAAVTTFLLLRGRVEVPNITGKTVADANIALTPLNLKIGNVTSVLDSAANVDKVLSQNPPAGQKVRSGGSIDVQVGVAIVNVPPIVGRPYNDAVTALHQTALNIGQVSNVNTPGATPGVVLSANPPPGNSVKSDSTVDLSVQEENVPVPNLIGQNYSGAVAMLTAANLKLGTVTGSIYRPVVSGNVTRGVSMTAPVIDQNPKNGTLPVGSQVNLVFPNGTLVLNPFVANQVAKTAHW